MSLLRRVSTFFLAALAAVLVSYSLLTYLTVRSYLYHRFDEQLLAAFNTLVAAVEVEDDDVKFEPTDHSIRLGLESDVDDIRWAIFAEELLVAHSANMTPSEAAKFAQHAGVEDAEEAVQVVENWRLLRHRVAAPAPKPVEERDPIEHAELTIVAARSNVDLHQHLRWLAAACFVLPGAIWLIAAAAGGWYCRRALAPVTAMAEQARHMDPHDTTARITVAARGGELADLGAAFNQLLDRLYDSLERQRRFAGDAAHQLRTPVTVLRGHIDVALRRPRDTAEYQETLAILCDQTAELSELIESLLFLARAGSEAGVEELREVAIAELLSEGERRWSGHARAADLQVEAKPGLSAWTSPRLLLPLLDNLVTNAFKYSPPGTPVVVSAQATHDEVHLSVQDEGFGISQQDQQAIFEPFFRTSAARERGIPGSGLGLSICRRLADALQARLECTSQLGRGSRFTVILPAALD